MKLATIIFVAMVLLAATLMVGKLQYVFANAEPRSSDKF